MHQGPTVTIEAQKAVVRVNQSKVRKDHDEWHDAPIPHQLKTEEELRVKTEKIAFEPIDVKKEEPQEAAHVERHSQRPTDLAVSSQKPTQSECDR